MAGKPVAQVAAAGQAAEAVFLHGGVGVRDEPEQRLGDIQQGQDGDYGADLVADDRAHADPERRCQGGRDAAADDDGGCARLATSGHIQS